MSHLDLASIAAGDVVIGTLPVHKAGEVCELGTNELERFGARLEPMRVEQA